MSIETKNIEGYDVEKLQRAILDSLTKKMDENYDPIQVQILIRQALESTYIIFNSQNVDTVIGRYRFIFDFVFKLHTASFSERYLSDLQDGLDRYKQLYYDRTPFEDQIFFIQNPSLQNLNILFFVNLKRVVYKYLEDYNAVIIGLKNKRAIKSRLEKAWKTIYLAQMSTSTCSGLDTTEFFNYCDGINKIIDDKLCTL